MYVRKIWYRTSHMSHMFKTLCKPTMKRMNLCLHICLQNIFFQKFTKTKQEALQQLEFKKYNKYYRILENSETFPH